MVQRNHKFIPSDGKASSIGILCHEQKLVVYANVYFLSGSVMSYISGLIAVTCMYFEI